jgi:TonB family protein
MCCRFSWQRLVSFAVALTLGVLFTFVFQKFTQQNERNLIRIYPNVKCQSMNDLGGSGGGSGNEISTIAVPKSETTSLRIISKPRPSYTDVAREHQVTGVVRLKVTFLASGEIGMVTPVGTKLPYGLTDEAMRAAEQIKFEPQKVNGVPQTVWKTVEYSFSIY